MSCSFIKSTSQQRSLFVFGLAMLLLFVTAPNMPGQKRRAAEEEEKPLFHEYRGIQIGMLADDVRKSWAHPLTRATSRTSTILTMPRALRFTTTTKHAR